MGFGIMSIWQKSIRFESKLEGKGGGGSSGGTQQVINTPWSGQVPYLQQLFQQAQQNYNKGGSQYYPGSTIAQQSPQTQQAIQIETQRAINGSPLTAGANQVAQDTLNGNYLNNNPWLDKTYNQAANSVTRNYLNAVSPGIDSTFSAAGRLGSNADMTAHDNAQYQLGNTLDNLATNIYGGNYSRERQNQLNTMQLAPSLANNDYTNINALYNAGNQADSYNQNVLNDKVNRFNYNQNLPYQNLQNYSGLINGNYGGASNSSSQYAPNTASNVLGGALMGYQAAPAIAGALAPAGMTVASAAMPWLGVAGALGGGLLGGLF
jgi:hypothetical protein